MATKFIARLTSKIVDTRTSQNRTYTHAIFVQRDEAIARDAAYNFKATETDRKNWEYDCEVARLGLAHEYFCPKPWRPEGDQAGVDKSRAIVAAAGSWEGQQAILKDRAIKRFEENKAKGYFEPFAVAWAGSLALAQKAARTHTWKGQHLVAIVPAEVVATKTAKVTA